jgi:periplasmic protein TonB
MLVLRRREDDALGTATGDVGSPRFPRLGYAAKMSATVMVPNTARPHAAPGWMAAPKPRDRVFWIGLACAVLVHAVIIIGVSRSLPRQMGEQGGTPDGISVLLVDAADLLSKTNVPATPDSRAGATGSIAPPPQPDAARPSEPAAKQKTTSTAPITEGLPDLFSLPDPAGKQSGGEATPKPKSKPAPPLDLSLPSGMFSGPIGMGGRSAALARPPGATRSGENDEFARGVIRALYQTMPRMNVRGRTTVRLLLNMSGNLAEVRLVRSAGDSNLDQSVVFAVKQSSFPFPPNGAKPDDLVFLVTYIYE